MPMRRRWRHTPEQIVRKLREANPVLNAGRDQAAVLQAPEANESTRSSPKNPPVRTCDQTAAFSRTTT